MSVNFPGGNHHIFSNIIPVTPENRPAAKNEAKASPEESKRWLEEVTSEKGDQKLAMGGGTTHSQWPSGWSHLMTSRTMPAGREGNPDRRGVRAPCRSRLAREKRKPAALLQASRVIGVTAV